MLRMIRHYRLDAKIGEGGMGVVYKAWDTHLDRPVAIKVLAAQSIAGSRAKAALLQEAKAASALNHPHIVTIYDVDCADGIDFIAMEYVEGETLDRRVESHGMRARAVIEVLNPNRRRIGARTRRRHRPSRSQAGQHHDRQVRSGEGPGLRPREAHRTGRRCGGCHPDREATHRRRHDPGDRRVHVAGAGRR